jgi:hypothetical protein
MATIKVVKPFMLQLDPKQIGEMPDPQNAEKKLPVYGAVEKKYFAVGTYDDVPDEVANHWYCKMHLEGYEEPGPTPGMPEYQAIEVMKPREEDPSQPAPADATAPKQAQPPLSAERVPPSSQHASSASRTAPAKEA